MHCAERPHGDAGMTTGEPRDPVRTTWAQVHAAACAGARVLVERGVRPGDAVAVLAAKPFEVAPVAQAAWLAGASVTMLHQPTARTNLATYAADTAAVLALIGARAIVLGDPFTDFVDMFEAPAFAPSPSSSWSPNPAGRRRTIADRRGRPSAAAADVGLHLHTEGRADHRTGTSGRTSAPCATAPASIPAR